MERSQWPIHDPSSPSPKQSACDALSSAPPEWSIDRGFCPIANFPFGILLFNADITAMKTEN